MDRQDIILILFGIMLLAAMVVTYIIGGEKSRHGVGKTFGYNSQRTTT